MIPAGLPQSASCSRLRVACKQTSHSDAPGGPQPLPSHAAVAAHCSETVSARYAATHVGCTNADCRCCVCRRTLPWVCSDRQPPACEHRMLTVREPRSLQCPTARIQSPADRKRALQRPGESLYGTRTQSSRAGPESETQDNPTGRV